MLKPAQLYKEELKQLFIETWYDPYYQYFWSGESCVCDIEDNNQHKCQFVWIENNIVIGYFSFCLDKAAKSAYNFGLINFSKNKNINFIRAVILLIEKMFDDDIIDRLDIMAYEDNPANKGYEKIFKKFGGKKVGKLTKNIKLLDGKLHNTLFYEILKEDYLEVTK